MLLPKHPISLSQGTWSHCTFGSLVEPCDSICSWFLGEKTFVSADGAFMLGLASTRVFASVMKASSSPTMSTCQS